MGRKAFTLFEVIIALFILVAAVSIISSMQFKAVMRIWQGREEIDRVFFIKKDLLDIFLKIPEKQKEIARLKDKPSVTTLEDPQLKITSQLLDIDKKSDLKKIVDLIDVVKTVGEWKSGLAVREIPMISFMLKPEEKDK